MDRRSIFFMIAASWIFIAYMFFFAPQPPKKEAAKEDAIEKRDQSSAAEDKKKDDSGKAESTQNGDEKEKDAPQEMDGAEQEKDPANEDVEPVAQNTDQADDAKGKADSEPKQPQNRVLEQKFISLGSLAADSPFRFLVTFDNRAASVHRLELAQRQKRNPDQPLYRDLEVRYGYLGHLDLTDLSQGGCLVKTVGSHTPADLAGIRVGDEITHLGDTEIQNRFDYEKALRQTRPGDEISLKLLRDGKEQTVTVQMVRQPLEVIRPTIVPDKAMFAFERIDHRMSYALSLFSASKDGNWEKLGTAETSVWESEVGDDWVKFYYPYKDPKEIVNSGADYQVIKTFRLVPVKEDERDKVQSRNYHLELDVEVRNLSQFPQPLAYRIDGPNGLPTEDWWFAIKIHGDWATLFSAAGARDIVASTESKSFHFIGGPQIYTNATKPKQKKPQYLIDPSDEYGPAHQLNFIGVDSHYFVSALIPVDQEGQPAARETYSAYAMPQAIKLNDADGEAVNAQRKKEAGWYRKLVPVNFKAYFKFENPDAESGNPYEIGPQASSKQAFMIFAGPKEPSLLQNYGIDDTVTYGWFAPFSIPLVKLLHLFYWIVGNYAVAIILLTVLVRLAMVRFSRKMVLNSQMMQLLAPEIKALTEKYKDDFQAKSRAQQELFKKYNYNPFSGCLVMMIQMPVFIGLYRGLSVDMALRDRPLIPGVQWCSNLAGPDQLWRWADSLPSFMSFLTDETGWLGPYLNILPIISVCLMLIQQKMFTPPPTDEQQAMMQKVMTFMMVFIGVMFFKVPAGLCIYFITSTLWAIMEKKMIPPPQLPDHLQQRLDELKALQAKEKEDGVDPGTYTSVKTTSGGNATRKHTARAKKRAQKNRRK
ncbi:MAG: YidC/Oxa1 family insertase periplasmic-domain containing protein [Planctomycetota bacterium]|nr:YidC/Oxa1 family insertase periplasmic-domain containing protein [Planctomycetota bacterium]